MFVLVTKNPDIPCELCFHASLLTNMHQFITLKYYFLLNSPCLTKPSAETSPSAQSDVEPLVQFLTPSISEMQLVREAILG